jgi:hypothetical protein
MAASMNVDVVDYQKYLATTQAGALIHRISHMVQEIETEMRHPERKHLFKEIRELRLALAALEFELRDEEHDRIGAAC